MGLDNDSLTPPNGGFVTSTVNYEAQPGDSGVLQIRLGSAGSQTNFNAVRLFKLPALDAVENLTQGTEYASIQAAINEANDFDVIEVPPGAYNEHIDLKGKPITLRSRSGDPTDTIVSALFTNGTLIKGPVALCDSGEDPNTLIEGITFTKGNGILLSANNRRGGGLYCKDASPTLRDCIFLSNDTMRGGGIFADNSQMTLDQCQFIDNHVANFGGGVYLTSGSQITMTAALRATCRIPAEGRSRMSSVG